MMHIIDNVCIPHSSKKKRTRQESNLGHGVRALSDNKFLDNPIIIETNKGGESNERWCE